ncbi:STAS domain-containing protein [Paenibacillus periandrae]|uniref:STAS domain-containing protein n=1 Tax=Paenibacillus periandrae TaxID=1761741 RepID=UPI001F09630D|nr:STAS domain-containing protein [Paenibacillus periandrae]
MCYEIQDSDQQINVILTGFISVNEATSIRQKLFPRLQQPFHSITFRLVNVTDMDSSGLGLMLAVQKIATDYKASITYQDVSEPLKARLHMAGITI